MKTRHPFHLPGMTPHLQGKSFRLATDSFVNVLRRSLSRCELDLV